MSLWRHVKVVLWSFVGLGRREHQRELGRAHPLVFVAVAFVLVLLFIGILALVVHQVAAGTSAGVSRP